MTARPLCVCCGKPIPKRTDLVVVKSQGSVLHTVEGPLYSKADCQRHYTNHTVASVSYWRLRDAEGRRRVASFTTWDGESYVDEFFCNGTCTRRFAYVMARAGRCTNLYNEAMAARAAGDGC